MRRDMLAADPLFLETLGVGVLQLWNSRYSLLHALNQRKSNNYEALGNSLKLKRRAVVAIAIIVAIVAFVTFEVSPYVIARGILGKTPFDSPSFAIQNLQL